MSIYSRRRHSPSAPAKDEDDTRQPAAKHSPSPPTHRPPPAHRPPPGVRPSIQDWAERRRAQPANYLLPASIKWFADLPTDVRPVALAAKYPRIINVIVQAWNSPAACRSTFEDLLADRRGTRQGFPADVHRDLVTLRHHYLKSFLSLED